MTNTTMLAIRQQVTARAITIARRQLYTTKNEISQAPYTIIFGAVTSLGAKRSCHVIWPYASASVLPIQPLTMKSIHRRGLSIIPANQTAPPNASSDSSRTKNDSGAGNDKKDNQSKTTSDYFLDNLGKIFFAAIASVILLLVRSSFGTSNQTKQRELLEQTSALDPLEIDDLRVANSPDFNSQIFGEIVARATKAFPSGEASYLDFVSLVVQTMREIKGEKFTVQFGHLVDRVVIDVLEQANNSSAAAEETSDAANAKLPLTLLLTLVSLALSGSVEDRVKALFDGMVTVPVATDSEMQDGMFHVVDNEQEAVEKKVTVSEADVIAMIGNLQSTCQLPPASQILATEQKYPVQQYRRGTPEEMVRLAKEDALGIKVGTKDSLSNREPPQQRYDLDEFDALLRSSFVCAWGECYGPRKLLKKKDKA